MNNESALDLLSLDLQNKLFVLIDNIASVMMYSFRAETAYQYTKSKVINGDLRRLLVLYRQSRYCKQLNAEYKRLQRELTLLKEQMFFIFKEKHDSPLEVTESVNNIIDDVQSRIADKITVYLCTQVISLKNDRYESLLPVDSYSYLDAVANS